MAVLLDDLHQADAETLALLETVAAGLAGSPLLLIPAYRPAETSGELDQALAALARRSPARLPWPACPLLTRPRWSVPSTAVPSTTASSRPWASVPGEPLLPDREREAAG